jgi:hypothetical protein
MITEVASRTGVPVDVLLGRYSDKRAVCIRQLYWRLLRIRKRYTFRRIAELNDCDTSRIQKGIKRVERLLESGDAMSCDFWNKIKDIK